MFTLKNIDSYINDIFELLIDIISKCEVDQELITIYQTDELM